MAETNKSKMMSEAEIIEAINADTLVSVSLGEGQPQKNVKLSTLASVVAGQMNIIRMSKNLSSNEKLVISSSSLGLIVVSSSSSGHSAIYLGSSFGVVKVFETSESFSSQIKVSKIDGGGIEVTNIHSVTRYVEVVIIANNGR